LGGPGRIEFRFQPTGKSIVLGLGRPRESNRRHHTGSEFADYFFVHGSVSAWVDQVLGTEDETAGLYLRTMATDAVLFEKRLLWGPGEGDGTSEEPKPVLQF
jgi:hypothetical protein